NADNAAMHAAENRTTLIYNDWKDSRVGADIVNYLNGYKDPRREKMLLPNVSGKFAGLRIGIDVASKDAAVKYSSNMIVNSKTPYLWLNAAEVAFLKAEYELRWGTTEAAKTLYEQAVTLSFEERGASGAKEYLTNTELVAEPYVDPLNQYSERQPQSLITIAWDATPEGAGDDVIQMAKERNLERIITQKWIAIFPLGVEGWSEYRRTGYPRLLPAIEDKSNGTVDLAHGARRMSYPIEEYQKNNANLQEAIGLLDQESQGSRKGDAMGTRVWWDCKPYNK
ncbi:MAG: SusD/RagB family nutrient-binding outer membrane lipoprotein, partial [Alistipes sp.]